MLARIYVHNYRTFVHLWGDGTREAATIKTAVAAWSGSSTQLPSLQAAYDEAPKVGLSSR